jgi:hypothetical protein
VQQTKAQSLERQFLRPSCLYPFPGSKDLGRTAVHHAAQREDDGVEGQVLLGRWRTLWPAKQTKYLLNSRKGSSLS